VGEGELHDISTQRNAIDIILHCCMRNMPGFTKTKAPGDWSVISKNGELLEFYGVIDDFQVGVIRLEPSRL
jgi:hypothetical protein